jgi:hypothetical protein
MTINVLFLCPHAAGKSVLAATYFSAAAARIGLDAIANVAAPNQNLTSVHGYARHWRTRASWSAGSRGS